MNIVKTAAEVIGMVTFMLLSIYTLYIFVILKKRSPKNTLLAVFLIANILFLLGYLTLALYDFFSINILWFGPIGASFGLLFGPSLYLFTKAITDENFKVRRIHFFHTIPFILQILNILFFDLISNIVVFFLMEIQILFYLYLCFKPLKQFEHDLRDYYSSIEKLNLKWLKIIFYAFIFMWIVDLLDLTFLVLLKTSQFRDYFILISISINFVFANMLFLESLQHPEIIFSVEKVDEPAKYKYSKLNSQQKKDHLNILEEICKSKKPYLSPNLTLDDLSTLSNIPSRQISQVINENLNKNFYDYINEFRIEEAKKILSETPKSKKTILEVIYEVGFNSKSVFNTAFKKQTGLTPTQFKRQFSGI